MIRALVFDVDGVLVRSGRFGRLLEERHGVGAEEQRAFFQGPFQDCVLGRGDVADAMEPFLELWGWPGSVDELLAVWYEADSERNERTLALVARARRAGLPCYIASTQEARRAGYLMDQVGLSELFEGCFFSCHLGASKPDRDFYDAVRDRVGVPADGILFFDDHEPNVLGARAAGWHAELVDLACDIGPLLERYGVSDLD